MTFHPLKLFLAVSSLACFIAFQTQASPSQKQDLKNKNNLSQNTQPVEKVLVISHVCSDSLVIRAQKLSSTQASQTCAMLTEKEKLFHETFQQKDNPVKHDFNSKLRVNIYASRDDYAKFATQHFNISTDNGGMYLEGLPHLPDNQAEFITYFRGDIIWNLSHEYIHYLDGRFNIYGDFCAALHDSHEPPENCAKPAPLLPHTVWWSEGMAEYLAKGNTHPRAFDAIEKSENNFSLSQIFDTSYEKNGGTERVYYWGYFATRYMLEEQRDKTEQMLVFLRTGDFPRYQALLRSWGDSLDKPFAAWLKQQLKEYSALKSNQAVNTSK